jgi:hypothetical protein
MRFIWSFNNKVNTKPVLSRNGGVKATFETDQSDSCQMLK